MLSSRAHRRGWRPGARRRAPRIAGCRTVADLRAAAESAPDRAAARRLWAWLAAIPGDESEAADDPTAPLHPLTAPAVRPRIS